jgi:hypothetical protein
LNIFISFKKKENRRPEKPVNVGQASSNSDSNGSVPKRYQSVFNNGTPLTSFGVENDENYPRTHSVRINRIFFNSISIISSLLIIFNHKLINNRLSLLKNFLLPIH